MTQIQHYVTVPRVLPSRAGRVARRLTTLGTVATLTTLLTSVAAGVVGLAGCAGLTDVAPPSNLVDTSQVISQVSAVAMYSNAIYNFSTAFAGGNGFSDADYATQSGLFADEFTTTISGTYAKRETHTNTPAMESRTGPYETLQGARQSADQAIQHLVLYGGTAPKSYIGEMYAIKGYVYLLLSELYCEGVPFSTLAGTGVAQYGDPETLIEMNNHAIAQFDSAATYATDSARILNLAAVGKGRAYLNLGDFTNAKAAVASVPTSFVYALTYNSASPGYNYMQAFISGNALFWMSDHEGGNGLGYISSPDSRLVKATYGGHQVPAKFVPGNTPIPLATGTEARLIEAEAALHANDIPAWTTTLNTLRASAGPVPVAALTADSTTTASDTLRVNVMFRERAFWMFGTGHRQGDMRRLIRQYLRPAEKVYSVGVLTVGIAIAYVPTPVTEVPQPEIDNNPKYHGCLNHDA